MKLRIHEDGDQRDWHRWFAWYPVRLARHDWRWLEMVWRRGTFHEGYRVAWWDWEYRA